MKKTIIILSLVLGISPVMAESVNKNMQATAKINASCTIVASDVLFGDYVPSNLSHHYANQDISFLCTKGTVYNISSPRSGTQGPEYTNYIHFGNNKLMYQVRSSNGIWGENVVGSGHQYTGSGTGDSQSISISYRLMPNQYVVPGNYQGTRTAIISF